MPATDRYPAIAVVGSANIDLITYTQRVPGPGETLVGDRFQMGFGGKGANQAVMTSLLGAHTVMVGALGDDTYGDMTLDNFASFEIETTHVRRVEGSSGVAPIWVEPDGTNRIIIVPGANDSMTERQAEDAVRGLPALDLVLGQLEIPQAVTAAGFHEARRRGATTILNPAPAATLDDELLAASDWLIPNEVEFAMLAGRDPDDEAFAAFADETGCRLVVTLGEAGVAVVGGDGSVERVRAPMVDAVDTTGAGDSFVGAFGYGLAAGAGERAAAALGVACAAHSVQRLGTQTSFPDRDVAASLINAAVG